MTQTDERITELGAALSWALDLIDMYDARLAQMDGAERVYTATHLDGKAHARAVLDADGGFPAKSPVVTRLYGEIAALKARPTVAPQTPASERAAEAFIAGFWWARNNKPETVSADKLLKAARAFNPQGRGA